MIDKPKFVGGAKPPPGMYAAQEAVMEKLKKLPEVVECHHCAGFGGAAVIALTTTPKAALNLLTQFGLLVKNDRALASDGSIYYKDYQYCLIDNVVVYFE